jgi:hypothetical protein
MVVRKKGVKDLYINRDKAEKNKLLIINIGRRYI